MQIGEALRAAGDAFSSGNRPVVEEPITSTKSFKVFLSCCTRAESFPFCRFFFSIVDFKVVVNKWMLY